MPIIYTQIKFKKSRHKKFKIISNLTFQEEKSPSSYSKMYFDSKKQFGFSDTKKGSGILKWIIRR